MRQTLLILLWAALTNIAKAQNLLVPTTTKSDLDSFSAKAGDFQHTEIFEIGKIKGLTIESIRIKV